MMPSVMDERHEEIRSESISGYHLSEKPVIRPLELEHISKQKPTNEMVRRLIPLREQRDRRSSF